MLEIEMNKAGVKRSASTRHTHTPTLGAQRRAHAHTAHAARVRPRTHTHAPRISPIHTMAASAPAYLKAFVESVAELPAELRRTFQLMRELDAKAAALQRQANLDARTCLLNGGKAVSERVGGDGERERRAAAATNWWRES